MLDQYAVEIGITFLDEFTSTLLSDTRSGKGFDNKSVMWLIKAWSKIGLLLRGPGYPNRVVGYYVMNRKPDPSTGKISHTLLREAEDFETYFQNNKIAEGDFFNRVETAMRNFVWEYKLHLPGQTDKRYSEKDFTAQLMNWWSKSDDQIRQEPVFNMDRSL